MSPSPAAARGRLARAHRRRSRRAARRTWADGRVGERRPRDLIDDRAPMAQRDDRASSHRRSTDRTPRILSLADDHRRSRRPVWTRTSRARPVSCSPTRRCGWRSVVYLRALCVSTARAHSSRAGPRSRRERTRIVVCHARHGRRLADSADRRRRARCRRGDALAEHALAALRRCWAPSQPEPARARLHRDPRHHDGRRRVRPDLAAQRRTSLLVRHIGPSGSGSELSHSISCSP